MSKHLLVKFGLLSSAAGGAAGLGLGTYYGGVLGGVSGAVCGMVLAPPIFLIASVAIGLACITAAALVAVPCFLGFLLMKTLIKLVFDSFSDAHIERSGLGAR